jgi:DNA invertase Pin-like site-specific DNA recombinase
MKTALYARVSTIDKDQNPEVQLSKLREYCRVMGWEIFKEYVDHASAADLSGRRDWTLMMKNAAARRFQVLVVWKIDRAFRSVVHACSSLNILKGYGVSFHSYMEPAMDTTTPQGEFLFNILAAVAELERGTISQRSRAGQDYARLHGTKSGLPIGRRPLNIPSQTICERLREEGSVSVAAKKLHCSVPYIYKVLKPLNLNPPAVAGGKQTLR